jgi:hypothetical protein
MIYGANPSITEASPFNAPALVSWKEPIERRVLGATDMCGVVIVSSVAYGDGGGGIPGLLLGSLRDDAGRLIMLGQQHWSTVHAADLADFFRRALEDESARGRYDRASARGVRPHGGHRQRSAECYTGPGRGNPARFAASWPQPTAR